MKLLINFRKSSRIIGVVLCALFLVTGLISCNKETAQSEYVIDHTFHLKDHDGKHLPNIVVELYYKSSGNGLLLFSKERTDSEGKISYKKLDAGDYQIMVHVPNIAPQTLDIKVNAQVTQSTMTVDTNVDLPTQLYMVGSATTAGDDLELAVSLQVDPQDPLKFTYNSVLEAGEFYFLSELGKPQKVFYRGNSLLVDNLVFSPDGESGQKFTVVRQGIYKLTVDFNTFVLTLEEEGKDFTELFAKGSAVPSGISRLMTLNRDRSGVFHFYEVLQVGEFQISTKEADDAYSPHFTSLDDDGNINSQEVRLSADEHSGNRWQIEQAGAYKITFDLTEMKIDIKPYEPFTDMWIMGNAVGAGFTINPSDVYKLKPVAGEPYSYYYEGAFGVNPTEFKVLLQKNAGWDVPYYMPVGVNRTNPFSDNRMMYEPSPYGARGDRKWSLPVGEGGTYRFTINQLKETISMEKL